MGYFTQIYIVSVARNNGTGFRNWFWEKDEAQDMFNSTVSELEDQATVILYRADAQQAVNDFVDEELEKLSTGAGESYLHQLVKHSPDTEEADVARSTLESMLASARDALSLDTARLEEYRADFKADPQDDTAAMIGRTERKIVSGQIRISALEYAVSVL